MLTEARLSELRKLRAYYDALLLAHEVLATEIPKDQPEVKVDVAAWKASQADLILACSGDKAALLGTLSTEPTVKGTDLPKDLLDARDEIRTTALEMRGLTT